MRLCSASLTVLQVEDTLFKVPRRTIENDSEIFKDMFSLPPTVQSTVIEGSCPEKPIVLEGILECDMMQLMRVLFPKSAPNRKKNDARIADPVYAAGTTESSKR